MHALEDFRKIFRGGLLAQDQQLFLGEDFFAWMVLALGGALVVGNLLAFFRPPAAAEGRRPSLGRTVLMVGVGVVGVLWGLGTLLAGS